jgi:hypothetical protein
MKAELRTNRSGQLSRRCATAAQSITDSFPDLDVLQCYLEPSRPPGKAKDPSSVFLYDCTPDLPELVRICRRQFDWGESVDSTLKKFKTNLFPGLIMSEVRMTVLEGFCERRSGEEESESSSSQSTVQSFKIVGSRQSRDYNSKLEYRVEADTSALEGEVLAVFGCSEAAVGNLKQPQVLRMWLAAEVLESVRGDLVEQYEDKVRREGMGKEGTQGEFCLSLERGLCLRRTEHGPLQ